MMEDEQNGENEQGGEGEQPSPNIARLYPLQKRKKARRPPNLEPEQGPTALAGLPDDNSYEAAEQGGEGMPNRRPWSFKCTCKHLPQMGAICIRSITWPGACCVFADGKAHNVYVGTGQKHEISFKDENQLFPPCEKEFSHRLEETTDPSVEQEAKKIKPEQNGDEGEIGGENDEEEDEEGSEEDDE